ncbi:MAG TPA: hypothetical protein VK558_09765 [Patescibacteria group bacterium]|nr:hypothetical protein [Patescibacteria group bacterium]
MTRQEFDRLLCGCGLQIEIGDDRAGRVIARVMARVEHRRAPPAWSLPAAIAAWAPPLSLARVAAVMIAAALLGAVVGDRLGAAQAQTMQLASLFTATPFFPAGS